MNDPILNEWKRLGDFICQCGAPHCTLIKLDRRLIHADLRLEEVRPELALERLTSGYRCPMHNQISGGEPSSFHMRGMAMDLSCGAISLADAFKMAEGLHVFGGIGLYISKHHPPFVHLDVGPQHRRWGNIDGFPCSGIHGLLKVLEEEERRI